MRTAVVRSTQKGFLSLNVIISSFFNRRQGPPEPRAVALRASRSSHSMLGVALAPAEGGNMAFVANPPSPRLPADGACPTLPIPTPA